MIRTLLFSLVVTFLVGCAEQTILQTRCERPSWRVEYDAKLSDRLFDTEVYRWPWYIIEHPDGHLENVTGENNGEVTQYRLTARVSSKYIMPHTIDTAYAWIDPNGDLTIAIYYESVELNDHLLISVRNGKFTATYWTYPLVTGAQAVWTISDANLTLEQSGARVGETLKAFVDFSINGVFENGDNIENRVKGFIKPKVMSHVPSEIRESDGA